MQIFGTERFYMAPEFAEVSRLSRHSSSDGTCEGISVPNPPLLQIMSDPEGSVIPNRSGFPHPDTLYQWHLLGVVPIKAF